MSVPQGKYWVFTYNNPTMNDEGFALILQTYEDVSYGVFQRERGENGTEHFQGYLEFSKLKRLTQLKKLNKRIHWERRKGTQQQAIDYCKKEDTQVGVPWEFGTPTESHQGSRTDLTLAVTLLRSTSLPDMAQQMPEVYIKYHRGFQALESITPRPKPVPFVHLLFGPPGCGKSRYFWDNEPEGFSIPVTDGVWFDGYRFQDAALIDDFSGRGSKLGLTQLLRLLDRYPLKVAIKGGFVDWIPKRIYITTNLHPLDWYDYATRAEQYRALVRRISRLTWWKHAGDQPLVVSRPDLDLSEDVTDNTIPNLWDHFFDGRDRAQLALDQQSGRLVSHAPEYFNF